MRVFIKFIEVLCVALFLVGIFIPELRSIMWAFPAGFAVGRILTEWITKSNMPMLIKVFDSRDEDVPPEIREHMKKMVDLMEKSGKLPPKREKCKDPHCTNCWGLADEDNESKV